MPTRPTYEPRTIRLSRRSGQPILIILAIAEDWDDEGTPPPPMLPSPAMIAERDAARRVQ